MKKRSAALGTLLTALLPFASALAEAAQKPPMTLTYKVILVFLIVTLIPALISLFFVKRKK